MISPLETALVMVGLFLTLIQIGMGFFLWLTARYLNRNEKALEEVRAAISRMNERLLADVVPRTEFELFLQNNRNDLREVFAAPRRISAQMARVEAHLGIQPGNGVVERTA